MATHVSKEFMDSGTDDFLGLKPMHRGYQELSELVHKKKAQAATDQASFDGRKHHWLRLLDELYQEIEKTGLHL